ncbi:MAG TPA: class I tRNA ligase family protein [Gaiellaceae bacterium]|nr:class I tRNA ligase family protein [Gaiellaceae bacterium]
MAFYLTTPIYYVNSTPHIGHAYTTIAADILVRHRRQRGEETFFLTGSDENASKNVRSAEAAGVDPKTYVDRLVEEHWRPLAGRIGASPDFFIRTTDEGHHRFVQGFVQTIYDNGHIYQDVYEGLYCVGCEAFKNPDELVDGKCPEHGIEPDRIEETNWFFRLSAFQEPLLRLYDERPDFVQPRFRYNEARSFIAGGLQDFSLSRAGQPWGVPIPWDPEQVVYVWVDALINYLSALTYASDGDLRGTFWPAAHHLIGKDILRFHCVFWPALLLAAGYDVPQSIFVHGYLVLDDRKISKSLGNVIDPLDLIDEYGVDPVRFWCARSVSFGQDGNVSLDGFRERYERELGNDLGNLLSRTTAMIARYRGGAVVQPDAVDPDLAAAAETLRAAVPEALDRYDITTGLERVWDYVRGLNRHVEQSKPWELAKDEARAPELDRVLYELADGLRVAAVALAAYVPDTAARILAAVHQPDDVAWENVAAGRTVATSGIAAAPPLFPRIDAPATA